MKHRVYSIISIFVCLFLWNSCLDDPDMKDEIVNGGAPILENFAIKETTATSVSLTAEITKENGIPVVECGFVYCVVGTKDTIPHPVADKTGKGQFTDTITGLLKNTNYSVKAYATNRLKRTSYSAEKEIITTTGLGTVATLQPDSLAVRGTSVTLKAIIEKPGEGDIEVLGFFLSKKENMLDKDSVTAYLVADTFTYVKTGLERSTTYYVKAFAKNKFGLFVGDKPKSFKTTDGTAKLSIYDVFDKEYHDVKIKAEVLDGGDSPIIARGICWGITERPTIANDTTNNGGATGVFNGHLTSLSPQKQYYARAYAINSYGVAYSDQVSFLTKSDQPTVKTYGVTNPLNGTAVVKGEVLDQGASPVLVSGICWSSTGTPTIAGNHIQISSGVNAFEDVITNLKGDTEYQVCAYAINGREPVYGNIVTFKTPPIFIAKASFIGGTRIPNSCAFFSHGSKGYLLGGDTGPECTNQLWTYDAIDNKWQEFLAFPDGKRKWQTSISQGNYGYVFGGSDNTKLTNKVFRYSVNRNEWTEIATNAGPAPFHSASGSDMPTNDMYLVGGCRDTVTNEVWHYSAGVWTARANFPIKQYGGIAISIGSHLYVGLGIVNMNGDMTNRLWTASGEMNTWTEEPTMPGGGNTQGGVVYKGSIYVVDDKGIIRVYNPLNKTWQEKSKLTTRNKSIHCMYVINELIYIGLGENSNDLIEYNPAWDN